MLKKIFSSSFWKLLGSFCSFFSVPLLLNKLDVSQYALWVTLTSLIGWISLFDFGAGYSLRNRIAEYIELNLQDKIKIAVSGTYTFFCFSAVALLVIFGVSLFTVDIFEQHKLLALILYVPLILSFPSFIGPFIYQGLSKIPALNFYQFLSPALWLLIVLLIPKNCCNILLVICILYSFLNFFLRYYLFGKSIKCLNIKINGLFSISSIQNVQEIVKNGSKFFILQISSLVLFSLGNIVVYNHLDSYSVSQYDTVNKVFLLLITLYNNIIAIFWTEISKCKALNERNHLVRLWKRLYGITILVNVALICAVPLFPLFIGLWTKGKIVVSNQIVLFFVIQFFVQTFSYAGAVFLNAYEKMLGQIILSALSTVLFFPIAILFLNSDIGIISIPLTTALVISPTLIYVFFYSRKLIRL